jgi:hypothetical protein
VAQVVLGCGVFGTAALDPSVFAACRFPSGASGIHQILIDRSSSPPTLTVGWQSPVRANSPPTVNGNVVWAVDSNNRILYGLDAGSGAVVAQHAFGLDGSQHFATPVIMGNLVLVTAGNQVVGFSSAVTSSTQAPASPTTSTSAPSTTTTAPTVTTAPATTTSTTSPSVSTTSP